MITKNKLIKLIEPHFENNLIKDSYEIKTIKAKKLLTSSRFDLAFKLLYIEMAQKKVRFSVNAYRDHIRAFSLGKFTEPGNEDKNSFDKFVEEFHKTFENIKENGFNKTKTLIPLSINDSIANGAHRVASAIYLDKKVECVELESPDHIYDYKFFYSRNVPINMLDMAAVKFIEYAYGVHVAFVWPTAQGFDDKIEESIPNIIYRKDISLNPNGAHNLLSQIYHAEEWLGSVEDDFSGSKGKLIECFKTFDPVRVIAFQANGLEEVLQIKEKIREIFKVGKHSIHITDTKEEAIRVARVVFNENGVHFLNYAKPNKYLSTHAKIKKFKTFMSDNLINSEDIVLDSGMVLSVYGLRESSDIDFLLNNNRNIEYNDEELEYHDEELEYHDEEKNELIYNSEYYFYFNDIKFISFSQLYKMKKNRAKEKDINDCKMMKAMMEDSLTRRYFYKIKQNIYYFKILSRVKIIEILKKIGLYEYTRNTYRKVKGIK